MCARLYADGGDGDVSTQLDEVHLALMKGVAGAVPAKVGMSEQGGGRLCDTVTAVLSPTPLHVLGGGGLR